MVANNANSANLVYSLARFETVAMQRSPEFAKNALLEHSCQPMNRTNQFANLAKVAVQENIESNVLVFPLVDALTVIPACSNPRVSKVLGTLHASSAYNVLDKNIAKGATNRVQTLLEHAKSVLLESTLITTL